MPKEKNAEAKSPSIREVFRRARMRAGLKQEDVTAEVPGLTQSTYSRFELGQAELDVADIFKIKDFLDKQVYRKAGAITSLAGLMIPLGPWSGKLTDAVTKELEVEYAQKAAAELDRLVENELPELRKKITYYERLLDRDAELIRSLNAEIADLKKRIRSKSPKKNKDGDD